MPCKASLSSVHRLKTLGQSPLRFGFVLSGYYWSVNIIRVKLSLAPMSGRSHNAFRLGELDDDRAKCNFLRPMAAAIPREYNFAEELLAAAKRARLARQDCLHRPARAPGAMACSAIAWSSSRLLWEFNTRPEERVLIALADSIDWPTVFSRHPLCRPRCRAGEHGCSPRRTIASSSPIAGRACSSSPRRSIRSLRKLVEGIPSARPASHRCPAATPSGICRWKVKLRVFLSAVFNRPPLTTCDDIAFWLYTSGSTGKPKASVHTHANLRLTNDLYAAPILGLTEHDVCYSVANYFSPMASAMRIDLSHFRWAPRPCCCPTGRRPTRWLRS